MDHSQFNWFTNFIRGLADDLLHNLYMAIGKLDICEVAA